MRRDDPMISCSEKNFDLRKDCSSFCSRFTSCWCREVCLRWQQQWTAFVSSLDDLLLQQFKKRRKTSWMSFWSRIFWNSIPIWSFVCFGCQFFFVSIIVNVVIITVSSCETQLCADQIVWYDVVSQRKRVDEEEEKGKKEGKMIIYDDHVWRTWVTFDSLSDAIVKRHSFIKWMREWETDSVRRGEGYVREKC